MLKKHPSKHERIIYLVRDFKDPQPEQIEGDKQYQDLSPEGLDKLSLDWFIEKTEPKKAKLNLDDDIEF